jgi:hypothetical protein
MLARTNLRRDDLFFMTLAELKIIHDQITEDRKNEISQLYHIADLIAFWTVKSGTGLDATFRRRELEGTLIPNPYRPVKNSASTRYPKNYSNKKEAERILMIWKVKPQNQNG